METVLTFLLSVGAIDKETCQDIVKVGVLSTLPELFKYEFKHEQALNLTHNEVKQLEIAEQLENLTALPMHNLVTWYPLLLAVL